MGGEGVYLGHGNDEGIDRTGLLPSGEAINGIGNGVGPSKSVVAMAMMLMALAKVAAPAMLSTLALAREYTLVRVWMALARVAAQARVYTMALALVWMALAKVVTAMESVSMALVGASTPTGATLELTSHTMLGPVDILRAVHHWRVRSLTLVLASTYFLVWQVGAMPSNLHTHNM